MVHTVKNVSEKEIDNMTQESINKVNELAELVRGNESLQSGWLEMYSLLEDDKKKITKHYANKYGAFNLEVADMEEAFDMALIHAVRKYRFDDEEVECPFYYYFLKAANTECRDVLRKAKTDTRKIICDYTSFSTPAATTKDGDSVLLGDALPSSFDLETEVMSDLYSIPKILEAFSLLKEKDQIIIEILMNEPDKKARKILLAHHFPDVKDATLRKSIQRARERFHKALDKVGFTTTIAC